MNLRRTLTAAGGLAAGFLLLMTGPAAAHGGSDDPFGSENTITVAIRGGNGGHTVGEAWVLRVDDGDGTETLKIHLHADQINESKVFLSDAPFTSRVNPGHWPAEDTFHYGGATGNGITAIDYVIDLGDRYAGKDLFAQIHVVVPGDTAYAGWQPGSPHYGNLPIPQPEPESCPAGQVMVDGVCVTPAPQPEPQPQPEPESCPAGQVMVDGVCVTPAPRGGTEPTISETVDPAPAVLDTIAEAPAEAAPVAPEAIEVEPAVTGAPAGEVGEAEVEAVVAGVEVTRTLPRTGGDLVPMALLGLILVLLGAGVTRLERRLA